MKKIKIILALIILVGLTSITQAEEFDWCTNLEGIQATPPIGYHVESDYTCTILQTPITIDLVQPGEEPKTIDIVPPNEEPKTIDVNPVSSSRPVTVTVVTDTMSVSTTTPSIISSQEELEIYLFNPITTNKDRIVLIENRIKNLLLEIIEILKEKIRLYNLTQ